METDPLAPLSAALASRVAAAAPHVVAIRRPGTRPLSGILWHESAVVTSEQALARARDFTVAAGGQTAPAVLAGRDSATNVAVLRLATPLPAPPPLPRALPTHGALVLALGAPPDGTAPFATLALIAHVGPAWHSMEGGHIARRLTLDRPASGAIEGGPVLDAAGALLGMATAGPRRRLIAIPPETIARVFDGLLAGTSARRGWLGVALQRVAIPEPYRDAAGQAAGLMVVRLEDGPARAAGCEPGDILLRLGETDLSAPNALRAALGAETVGVAVPLHLLRGGTPHTLSVIIAAAPDRSC